MFNFFRKKKLHVTVPNDKADYIVVFHYWHVHSKGFDQVNYIGLTDDEVYKEALVHKAKTEESFSECAFHIVKIKNDSPAAILIA